MTKREIIQILLDKKLPERVGLNEHFWPHLIENSWGEQGIENNTDFVKKFNLDLRSCAWFEAPGPREDLCEVVDETEEWIVKRDSWGATMKNWKHKSGTPEHVDFSMTNPEVWNRDYRDAFLSLDLDERIDWEAIKKDYTEARKGDEFITYSSLFVFEELRRILGDLCMLESIMLEPEWIDDFCSAITKKNMEYYENLFTKVGLPDGIHVYEDLGYTANAFVSPQCHRERILPHHKKLFSFFKDYGLPIIFHTCGDFRPHLDSIVEAGADCIQAIEAKAGINVVEIAEVYKEKLCFMGNIDIMSLETGDKQKIKEECMTKLEGMKDLRAPYIYMSDHSIPPSVDVKDYEYMLELFWDNCEY